MRRGAETDDTLLHKDNVKPHTNAATCDAIARLWFMVLPHPAYSPDLIPSNFHPFPKQKEDLRSQNYSSHEKVKAAALQWFWKKEKDLFYDGIKKPC
jgi:histone-lysine N-methyltransferase SETMAR